MNLTEQELKDIYVANLKPRHNAQGVNVGNYVDVNGMMQEAYQRGREAMRQCVLEAMQNAI